MPKFVIQGGKPLQGEVKISGSKNAALPILCATLLTNEECEIKNVPDIADVKAILEILKSLGAEVEFFGNTVKIKTSKVTVGNIPQDLICQMRASILLLGPLLAREGEAKMTFPGGCVLGKRPVFAHTYGLEKLGCEVLDERENLHLKNSGLRGEKIIMPELSVTATENVVMAAVLAKGETEIRLAAAEPHVQDLCRFLNKMGAKIEGIGTHTLKIQGVSKLNGASFEVSGDYLEAGTFAVAAAITKGHVKINGIDPEYLDSFWQKLAEAGVEFKTGKNFVEIFPSKNLKAVSMIRTAVYPSFPTDLQAPFTILMSQAQGVSKVFETLFDGRLNYLFELEKMGAKVEIMNPHQALVIGPTPLKGIPISSCDIRAGAAMVIAALSASGETEISNIKYIDRGYEKIEEKLRGLGASVRRIEKIDLDRKQSGLDRQNHSAKVFQLRP
jgi:UDP-N-acetylglucosamine 1-carboxyvinyltransferase